jgi:hypothetical protein
MKALTIAATLAASALLVPAYAQTDTGKYPSTQQNQPGVGGTSKPGIPGKPGMSSGPADQRGESGAATGEEGAMSPNEGAAGSDESKVPGAPGNKSGPTEQPPSK